MRTFTHTSSLTDGTLHLALSQGLGINGTSDTLSFFTGFTTQPHIIARALTVLADITATRYYNYAPQSQRDPILSAHGDRLRAECFSACNSVYACLDINNTAFDGADIGWGCTNVDITTHTRTLLNTISPQSILHLTINTQGLHATTQTRSARERPVAMPARWIPALGNVAQILMDFEYAFEVGASAARAFLAGLPPVSATPRTLWVSPSGSTLKVTSRSLPGSVSIPGAQRLSALKRILPHARGIRVFKPVGEQAGSVLSVELPAARLTLALTEEAWRGFSGEGALLVALANAEERAAAEILAEPLAFDPQITPESYSQETGLTQRRIHAGLALLAAQGRIGWDPNNQCFYHRELPADNSSEPDNPRLRRARQLIDTGNVYPNGTGWTISTEHETYHVTLGPDTENLIAGAQCHCYWYCAYQGRRGPCHHILAASLAATRTSNHRRTQ